jgi:uncharacterized protein (TIGR02145 family)
VCVPDSSKKFYVNDWRTPYPEDDSVWVMDRDSSGWSFDFEHLNTGSIQDARDGNVYKTVAIKGQMWINENIRYEKPNSFCYHDSTKYCGEHGRFYKWDSVDNVCPEGWHLPSWLDYAQIIDNLSSCHTIESDESVGFCGIDLFYGMRYREPYYLSINQGTHEWNRPCGYYNCHYEYWTSDIEINDDNPKYRVTAIFNESGYDRGLGLHDDYYNIRCVKDSEE